MLGNPMNATEIFKIDLNPTMGCLCIGVMLATWLYAIACAQAMYYFWNYPRDGRTLRIFVLVVWIMESIDIVSQVHQLWFYLVARHSTPLGLLALDRATTAQQVAARAIQLVVQWFMLQKIYQLLSSTRLRNFHIIGSGVVFLMGLGSAIALVQATIVAKEVHNVMIGSQLAGHLTVVAQFALDAYITGMLCYHLRRHRNGFRRTDVVLERLAVYTINRGVLLCLLLIPCLVAFPIDGKGNTLYSALFSAPLGALYVNCLLAVLNVRNNLGKLEVEI